MNMEKLTTKFQETLDEAQSIAVGRDHRFMEPAAVKKSMLLMQKNNVKLLKNIALI